MGHALNNTLQDILARYKRMRGYEVLWMPGTDHAGIATQHVVEKMLRTKNLDRQTLGREKFLEKVWEWREKYGHRIVEQLKRLGCSCDWERLRFTMDEGLSRAVREVFVRLYRKGLVYKGHYIINWCPRCRTALSDEEVSHREILGHLYSIKYSVEGSDDSVIIATTRPETMLGDTGVGFHPKDARYARFRGKTFVLPLLGRKLRVVEDEHIDPQFGTGALKITPAHDPVDFDLGQKHGLEFINILNPDGTLNANAGPYAGLDRFEARNRVLRDLEERRLLLETKEHRHAVGHCYRCDTIVEPYCSDQWFVRMKPLAKPALRAVEKGDIRFIPERWSKVYLEWMRNIRDWCISRQIWWGHRIPVWHCTACAEKKGKEARPIVAVTDPSKCPACGSAALVQEEDVLDTWFSSWLWPFSTMGWPDKTPELAKFYPTTALVTGYEIIFFWVARMIMAGFEFMKAEPFRDVYIHGIVRDATGAKMSKSLGNIVDPIDIIDEFGADALRFAIISITSEGQDVYASKERFEPGRNFANKIWNASRFALLNLKGKNPPEPAAKDLTPVDRWVLSRLHGVIRHVTESLEHYRFNDAATALQEFFWHEFCDWYLELIKPRMDSPASQWVLAEVLRKTLLILHPFMPFVTEEIWALIGDSAGPDTLMAQPWPPSDKRRIDPKAEEEIGLLIHQVQAVRNVRSAWQIKPTEPLTVIVRTAGPKETQLYKRYAEDILHLAKIGSLKYGHTLERPPQSVTATVGRFETYVVLAGLVDFELETHRIRTALDEVEKVMKGLESKLANAEFTSKAPREVVERERSRYRELEDRRRRLQENLKILGT
jgi:valyl-tRNA synthetase